MLNRLLKWVRGSYSGLKARDLHALGTKGVALAATYEDRVDGPIFARPRQPHSIPASPKVPTVGSFQQFLPNFHESPVSDEGPSSASHVGRDERCPSRKGVGELRVT